MLDEIESETVQENEEDHRKRKKSKTLSEVKPIENISKNLQFSRDKSRLKGSPSLT